MHNKYNFVAASPVPPEWDTNTTDTTQREET